MSDGMSDGYRAMRQSQRDAEDFLQRAIDHLQVALQKEKACDSSGGGQVDSMAGFEFVLNYLWEVRGGKALRAATDRVLDFERHGPKRS